MKRSSKVDKNKRFELALKKILKAIVNLSGKVSSHSKDIKQLQKELIELRYLESKLVVIDEKIKTIKNEDIKNIHDFLKLVATKRGLSNAVHLLRTIDIKAITDEHVRLKKNQLTWKKVIAGITSVLILLYTLKQLIEP